MHPDLDVIHRPGGEQHSDQSRDRIDPLLLRRQHEIDEQDAESKQRKQSDGEGQQIVVQTELGRKAH